jgi:hypothetical protein
MGLRLSDILLKSSLLVGKQLKLNTSNILQPQNHVESGMNFMIRAKIL